MKLTCVPAFFVHQIDPALYAQAVSNAEATKSAPSGAAAAANTVRFTTRLNEQHMWKWQIAASDTFAKVTS
jgi:hypothetical protein